MLLMRHWGYSQQWLPVGPGIGCGDGEYVWDLSHSEFGDSLLIAGRIASDGSCEEMRAAIVWSGSEFYPLGNIFGGTESNLVFQHHGVFYSSGHVISSEPEGLNYIESGQWLTFPGSFGGGAKDFLIRDSLVYLAGAFSGTVNGLVCTFDGEVLQDYYTGPPCNDITMSLAFYQDTLFIAGGFTSEVSAEAQSGYNKCCKIVNGQLEKVSQGFLTSGFSWSVKEFQDKLYIGGYLRTVNGDAHHTLYYYENGQLHTLADEPDDLVTGMVVHGDGLYVCGDFHTIGDMPCEHVARWDGEAWTCLCNDEFTYSQGACDAQCIKDIEVWKDTLYIGGYFTHIADTEAKRIAKLDMNLSEAFPVHVTENKSWWPELFIQPNPARNRTTIRFSLPPDFSIPDHSQWVMIDLQGREIMRQDLSRSAIQSGDIPLDLSSIAPGIYQIHWIMDSVWLDSVKVVVE
jgi:hypothetical protein